MSTCKSKTEAMEPKCSQNQKTKPQKRGKYSTFGGREPPRGRIWGWTPGGPGQRSNHNASRGNRSGCPSTSTSVPTRSNPHSRTRRRPLEVQGRSRRSASEGRTETRWLRGLQRLRPPAAERRGISACACPCGRARSPWVLGRVGSTVSSSELSASLLRIRPINKAAASRRAHHAFFGTTKTLIPSEGNIMDPES